MGRGLQDRRPLRRHGHRLADGSGQEKLPLSNRGAALWGNLLTASYPPRIIATNKNTARWCRTNLSDGQVDLQLTAAPLPVKDKIMVSAAGTAAAARLRRARRRDRQAVVAEDVIPAPGEPAARPGRTRATPGRPRRRHVGDRHLTRQQPADLGHPQPGADVDAYRPGDNLSPTA
jgi:hypothetical protein